MNKFQRAIEKRTKNDAVGIVEAKSDILDKFENETPIIEESPSALSEKVNKSTLTRPEDNTVIFKKKRSGKNKSFYLDPDVISMLVETSKREDVSESAIVNAVLRSYFLKRRNKNISVNEIKIQSSFEKNMPRIEKIEEKKRFFIENGRFEKAIVCDKDGLLIDGYATYLAAIQLGVESDIHIQE